MPELPYMPFFPADWLVDTGHLKPDAYQAYHRLLCHMWLTRTCSLPNDPAILKNRAGVSPQKWPHVWPQIEGFFDVSEEGLLYHQKLTYLRGKARARYTARQEAGHKGANAKWRKTNKTGDGKSNGKANDKRDGNHNQTIINNGGNSNSDLKKRKIEGDAYAIKSGKRFLCGSISAQAGRAAIKAGLVTEAECKAVGVL